MTELLTTLTPVVAILGLALFLTLERWLPYFEHGAMQYPAWFERWGSLLMATPDWHRVHHSSHKPETDSHYGCLFSMWDRLFGTAGTADVPRIRFGIETFREPSDQTTWQLLKMPFK